jgi:hypothetical protein
MPETDPGGGDRGRRGRAGEATRVSGAGVFLGARGVGGEQRRGAATSAALGHGGGWDGLGLLLW